MTEPTPLPGPRPRRRWPWLLLLLGSLTWLGLVAGTAVGARFVPAGSGLAGPAIALGYGVMGAGIALVLGALLAWKASHGLLRAAATAAVVLALAAAGLVAWGIVKSEQERRAKAGMDVPLPPPGGFRIESRISEADDMRRYRDLTVDADTWTATWTAVGPEAATCTAVLIFDEADALFGKRAEIRDSHDRYASLCPVSAAAATHVYALHDSDRGAPSWEILADSECLQLHPELAELHWLLGRIPTAAVSDARADCEL